MIRKLAIILSAALVWPAIAQAQPRALVSLATAESKDLHPDVKAYGAVEADPDYVTTVTIPRDVTVLATSVRAGQIVQVGDAIVTIETAPGAAARFQQARSQVAFAKKDLDHTRSLYEQKLATKSQLASAEKALADARAQLDAETKVGAGQKTEVLRANVAGIVTAVNATPGDRISANAIIATIATRNRLLLNLGLEPEDALQVPVGAEVSMRAPQSDRISFNGTIQSVNAMLDPKSRLVNAVVGIPQDIANKLVLGMVLEGEVELPAQSGIVVPRSALMTDRRGTYVFVVKDGVATRHNVAVTLETDADAEIKSDVAEGDQVVISGNAGVEDGSPVRVQ